MNEMTLVEAAKSGDQASLGELYEIYYERVLQYAYRRTFDQQVAYDITANTFVKIAEKIKKFEMRHENAFVGWLFRIASNEIIAYYRKPEKYKSSVFVDDDEVYVEETAGELLDTAELYRQLYISMRTLKQKEQEVVDLYYFENMSYKEISAATGIREGSVGVLLHRAIKKLQKTLEPLVKIEEGGITI